MKRIYKIILATLLIPIGVIVLYFFVITPGLGVIWQSRTKSESIRVLEDVNPAKERQHIYGPSDVSLFLTYPDGSWMAFRYKDRHAGGLFSSTIVRDSGGQWFESDYHFCGLLRAYRLEYEMQIAAQKSGEGDGNRGSDNFEDIRAVGSAQCLIDARAQLLRMGFTPMKKISSQSFQ